MGGVSMEWKELQTLVKRKIGYGIVQPGASVSKGVPIIKVNNIISGLYNTKHLDKTTVENDAKYQRTKLKGGELIVTVVGTCGKTAIVPPHFAGCNLVRATCLIDIEDETICRWVKYYIDSPQGQAYINRNLNTTVQATLNVKNLNEMPIPFYSTKYTSNVVKILSSLDRKIELNNKINADLEEMAQAIFKNWFVDFEPFKDGKFVDSELGMIPEGWKVGRLTEIASYMNGLAMQKFPPENNEDSLPVLKIKELGQGFCGTDSDRCSCNIKDECKIHNGDVIFSWSGTLLVDVWCGGDCGLNQHLFKVTSKDYPKWFYYYWTKHHLQEFIHIAKDKAVTMGHIKRGHLEEALVAIPDNDSMERAHELFEPILSKMISLRLENSRLSLLRDTLLPRLMSGELEVPE